MGLIRRGSGVTSVFAQQTPCRREDSFRPRIYIRRGPRAACRVGSVECTIKDEGADDRGRRVEN